ncbi:DUF6624 domain-containing protein [Algoriphagus resistens]|uniref:DUF6624 domain-containing protein n=1 Tax=Algoriphagus resistens TaxID=1750590 RepID=UPI000716B4F3|nr:DUF6624 domain-containing protein [Algoriphagus resistens]
MKIIFILITVGILIAGCGKKDDQKAVAEKVEFNQELTDELKKMVEVDQIAAFVPQGKYKEWSAEKWDSFKDSVFTTHQKRLKQIFDEYGFVGFDLAGEDGSQNFWLMVQHSDHNPEFQKEVLEKMKTEVENENAKPTNYGLLVDRVRLNTGEKQVYGTQVTYNLKTGQAYPKSLEDSVNVNVRRSSIGLEPIEEYLNRMTEMHFEMNKDNYLKIGVTEPKLY